MRLRVPTLLLAALAFLLASPSMGWGQDGAYEVIALDTLAVEGSETLVKAKVFKRGSNYVDQGVAGQKVTFKVGGKVVGTAVTDANGLAVFKVKAKPGNGLFEASLANRRGASSRRGPPPTSRGNLFGLKSNKPIIISDVDHTLAVTPRVDLTTIDNQKIPVIKGSRAMLNALAKEYQIVYVSGRYDRTFKLTKDWIKAKGYPAGPVMLNPKLPPKNSHASVKDFKSVVVGDIVSKFKNVPMGFGDLAIDMKAYIKNGLKGVLIGNNPKAEVPKEAIHLKDWSRLPAHRLLVPSRHFTLKERVNAAFRAESAAFGETLAREGRNIHNNLRSAMMITFLLRLADYFEHGEDPGELDRLFEELKSFGFYQTFGAIEVGRISTSHIYNRYLDRFVKPRFMKGVLRSQLPLLAAMALPQIMSGNFDTKTFVIDFSVMSLSFAAVEHGLKGISSALKLKRLQPVAVAGSRVAGALKMGSVPGWVYQAAKVTIIIYFGNKLSMWVQDWLKKRESKKNVAKAAREMLKVVADPDATMEEKKKAIEKSSSLYHEYRNFLLADTVRLEEKLARDLGKLGKEIRGLDEAKVKFEKILKSDPEKYGILKEAAKRAENKIRYALEDKAAAIFKEYYKEKEKSLNKAYKAPRTNEVYVNRDMISYWLAGGARDHTLGDPYSGRNDLLAKAGRAWLARSFDHQLRDLPTNRLQVYESERDLLRLALSVAPDKTTRDYVKKKIKNVEKMRKMDAEFYRRALPSDNRPVVGNNPPKVHDGAVDALRGASNER